MPAVTVAEMRAAECAAIANGWTEESLLDLAGRRLGHAIGGFFPISGTAVGYLGKGHNAGDAIVALGVLRDHYDWKIAVRNAFPLEECAPLTRQKWLELGLDFPPTAMPVSTDEKQPMLLLDGLLGIGAVGALREPLSALSLEMEWLRQNCGARIAAVDLPSGVNADDGTASPGAVVADITFMIGNAKHGLLCSHAANFTGALALVPVEPITAVGSGRMELISPQTMGFAKSRRTFDFHKGMAGRVGIVAGSSCYSGAAVLAATGALRGGAGLVTLYVPHEALAVIAAKCPPEVIVRGISSADELRTAAVDAWVVGCGIGELDQADAQSLLDLIAGFSCPAVIDADALNVIAKSGRASILNHQHLLTPHPGEFQRLAPHLSGLSREAAARAFTDEFPGTLLLKGCHTLIARAGQSLWSNSTGNPGMATGGQGDLLAGVIGARLAHGDEPDQAAALAAWLCGRAAEISLESACISEESLLPSDVACRLGAAFHDWQCAAR